MLDGRQQCLSVLDVLRLPDFLGKIQEGVSKLEKRSNLLIFTLRSYVEAMGGHLSLVAEFPDHDPVVLSGIAAIEPRSPDTPGRH